MAGRMPPAKAAILGLRENFRWFGQALPMQRVFDTHCAGEACWWQILSFFATRFHYGKRTGTVPAAMIEVERFCLAIKEASKSWYFPSSISVGIATYPKHGSNTDELLDEAEATKERTKKAGKDRVILAE